MLYTDNANLLGENIKTMEKKKTLVMKLEQK